MLDKITTFEKTPDELLRVKTYLSKQFWSNYANMLPYNQTYHDELTKYYDLGLAFVYMYIDFLQGVITAEELARHFRLPKHVVKRIKQV